MRIILATGRNMLENRDILEKLGMTWLVFPWTSMHPQDGASALENFILKDLSEGSQDVLIITFAEWIFAKVGELIESRVLRPDQVEILLFEEGEMRRFEYDNSGVIVGNWPIGYFSF